MAVSGDRIEVVAGTYPECMDTGGKDLDFEGLSGSAATLIEGSKECTNAWSIQGGETVSIAGFQITHGTGRGLFMDGSHAILSDVELFHSGSADLDGGAIYISGGSLVLNGATLSGNTADRGGHILMTDGAEVTISASQLSDGQATRGGAIFALDGSGGGVSLSMETSTIQNNLSDGDGGAVYLESAANMLSSANEYIENQVDVGDGGAIYLGWASTLSSVDDSFIDNGSSSPTGTWGGALSLGSFATAELDTGNFSGNVAGTGGAISAGYDNVLGLTNCSFDDHEADVGGAIAIEDGGRFTDQGSTYEDNVADDSGGAIWVSDGVEVALTDLVLTGNQAVTGVGGALFFNEPSSVSMMDSTLTANMAEMAGGGMWVSGSSDTLELDGIDFTANTSQSSEGGGLAIQDASVLATELLFLENQADSSGGAIWATSMDDWQMSDSIFQSNSTGTSGEGGAIWMSFIDILQVEDSVFCNNSSDRGGAVYGYFMSGGETWIGTDFQENSAQSDGGAFYVTYSADQVLQNNTFVGNMAGGVGGTIWATGLTTQFVNNIVVHTQSGDGLYLDDSGSDSDSSWIYSNWYDNSAQHASGESTLDVSVDGNLSLDPLFDSYSMDGDCSNDLLTLSTVSPLIDAGDPTLLDDDGSPSNMGAAAASIVVIVDEDEDGFSTESDCDDTDPEIGPHAEEVCDGVDNDCSGTIDDGPPVDALVCHIDQDGDGFGMDDLTVTVCECPSGYVLVSGDCDDLDEAVHPQAEEIADDGIDNDCDGLDAQAAFDSGDWSDTSDPMPDSGLSAEPSDSGTVPNSHPGGDVEPPCSCGVVQSWPLFSWFTGLWVYSRRRTRAGNTSQPSHSIDPV